MAVLHACPRCGRMIPVGIQYCDTCRPLAEQQRAQIAAENQRSAERRYNAKRDPKYKAFYRSKVWRTMSRAKLQAVGYQCEAKLNGCSSLACEVHHKVPIQTPEGWQQRLTWDNLEALCTQCHNGRHPEKLKKRTDPGVIDLKAVARSLGTPGGGSDSAESEGR